MGGICCAWHHLFPVVTGVHQGCILAPTLFSTCMDWILGRMSERSSCSALFGNVKISDLDITDDAIIFAETLDILLGPSRCWMRSRSCWDYRFPGSKLRSRLSMTSWMLLSCLYLFVARMLRSWRDSLILAVIFISPLAVSQRSIDVCVRPVESWIHWVMRESS